ncbi:hypothetical protein TSMEX_010647 [Taenia solium]
MQCAWIHFSAFLFFPFEYHGLAMMMDRRLKILWDDGQCEILELPGQASPWFCDMDHVVDETGMFNGVAIGFTSFGTSIG